MRCLMQKNHTMKKLPVDVSDFETLIRENYLYVDKTRLIYDLVTGGKHYFLSRPRRFGKTLLISTLKALFAGRRDLFKDLWIDSSDYAWESHPVISLDFSTLDSSSPEDFKKSLAYDLDLKAKKLSIDTSGSSSPSDKLKAIILELVEKNKVVILVDEYDYPIINMVQKPEVWEGNLEIIKNFFTVIKGLSNNVRALFITGVSQIPKASIFSGLNNPNNISLDPRAACLLGYTKEEVLSYFSENITQLAFHKNKSQEELLDMIRFWYNGYRFSPLEEKVYNPFSLHYLFAKSEFANYWFNSATPSFLIELLKKNEYVFEKPEQVPVSGESLSLLTIENPKLIPLLFQTGYITISSYDEETQSYTLNYPNYEVQQAYSLSLMAAITHKDSDTIRDIARHIRQALIENDMDKLCSLLESLFTRIPHQINKLDEKHYHSMMYLLVMLLPFDSDAEKSTFKGRIDLVIKTSHFIYIFEVKTNTSARTALEQIEKRTYYEEYLTDGRTVILVGLAFNKKDSERTISCEHKVVNGTPK